MALTKDVKLPSDAELAVPQEITLSTPWFKAVAPYMAKHCEQQINVGLHSLPSMVFFLQEFMLRRKELEDPRATLKEGTCSAGAAVTACGIEFLQSLKKSCMQETEKLANCIDHGSAKLYMSKWVLHS
ncbi:hypothetical protein ANCCEY_12751 [Ancylostoma ceylanicum]|uniref:Uncharacterized protein n=1 Tax=Ancylostoma ceylanicum TaxID=53326 RepID=A0A0D6L8J3_9BILA|nr:hypothetical protein ANCCEY_12751 [Ancylostoma ceylanicum]